MHSIKDQEKPTDSQSFWQRAKQEKGEARKERSRARQEKKEAGRGKKRKAKGRRAKEGIGKKMQEQETARLGMRRKVWAWVCSELSNRVRGTENEAEKKRAEKKKLSLSWKETGEIA